ncbi:MAG TPA: ABC transporter permease [Thermomicrobiales bacterium]|nr:ABC transporter permease [Thermomicrobiales bacterium]
MAVQQSALRRAARETPPSQADVSLTRLAWRRFRRHHLGVPSAIVLGSIVLLVIAAPIVAPTGPTALNVQHRREPPSFHFLFGTDNLGRDVFARVLYGGRVSLSVAAVAVIVTFVVGITLGLISGYYGGIVDMLIQRVVEIVIAIPGFILIIVIISVFNAGIYSIMVILGLIGWGGLCRFVRGQILALREEDFVLAARCLGATNRRIMLIHVLPNVIPFVLVLLVLAFANFILIETSLSYLGLGVQQPTPSWGNLVAAANSVENIEQRPWLWLPAGLAITLTVLAVNFIGDALRDALDPNLTLK